MRRRRAVDAGDIVVGWLVKLVAAFAVVGVLAFDGISLGIAQLAVTDTAAAAARTASTELVSGATPQQAYIAARETAVADAAVNALPEDMFLVSPEGAVTLTVVRTAPTLVLHLVPRLDSRLVASATTTHEPG